MEILKKLKNTMVFMAIIYLLLGVIMFLFPDTISDFICYFVGILFLFLGISGIVTYIKADIKGAMFTSILVVSILSATLGVYIVINPKLFASFIPLVMGIFLIVDAISKLSAALDLKKFNYGDWWQMLIVSLVILTCGFILLFNPFEALTVGIRLIGILLVVDSISNVFAIYSYSKASKDSGITITVK